MLRRTVKKFFILILLGACYAIAVACFGFVRTSTSRLNTILESKSDCSVPCWQNLEPGVSSLGDFQSVRGSFPSLKYFFVRQSFDYLENPIYHWFDFRTGMPTEIYLENDRIIHLTFTPGIKARADSQASSMKIEVVFSELGQPDTYIVERLGLGAFGILYLFYEDEGLVFTIVIGDRPQDFEPSTTCILPVPSGSPVRRITLVSPGASENMLLDALGESFAKGLIIREWEESEGVVMEPCY